MVEAASVVGTFQRTTSERTSRSADTERSFFITLLLRYTSMQYRRAAFRHTLTSMDDCTRVVQRRTTTQKTEEKRFFVYSGVRSSDLESDVRLLYAYQI